MNFNRHSNLEGQHAFLGASKYHWIFYDEAKVAVLREVDADDDAAVLLDRRAIPADVVLAVIDAPDGERVGLVAHAVLGVEGDLEHGAMVAFDRLRGEHALLGHVQERAGVNRVEEADADLVGRARRRVVDELLVDVVARQLDLLGVVPLGEAVARSQTGSGGRTPGWCRPRARS